MPSISSGMLQPGIEDVDADEPMTDTRASAIAINWIVSFILIITGSSAAHFLAARPRLGQHRHTSDPRRRRDEHRYVGHPVGALMWMGVREIFGGGDGE